MSEEEALAPRHAQVVQVANSPEVSMPSAVTIALVSLAKTTSDAASARRTGSPSMSRVSRDVELDDVGRELEDVVQARVPHAGVIDRDAYAVAPEPRANDVQLVVALDRFDAR